MALPVLALDGVDAVYVRRRILESVSLSVAAGEIVALVGPNGAGKSTVLKAAFGLARVTAGQVRFGADDITGATPAANRRRGIAYLPQGGQVFAPLSVEEHLKLAVDVLGSGDVDAALARFPALAERRRRRAGELSGGERQQLSIAMALLGSPTLLLADEPTIGLAPRLAREAVARLAALRDELGTAVLLVEQNVALALEHADRVVLLINGRVAADEQAPVIRSDASLSRQFSYGLADPPAPVGP